MDAEDPVTEELRIVQSERERAERKQASEGPEDAAHAHERRADKAEYLRERLEERAESERRAREDQGA